MVLVAQDGNNYEMEHVKINIILDVIELHQRSYRRAKAHHQEK